MHRLLLETPWGFGLLLVSGLGGALGSFGFFLLFRALTGTTAEKLRSLDFFYTGVVTGVVERFFFTAVIGLLGTNGIVQAAVAWIAIKGQVHYKMFSDASRVDLARAYLGLLGSLASLLFAFIGGYLWSEQLTWSDLRTWIAQLV